MERVRPSSNLKQLTLLYVEDESGIREPFLMMVERYFKKVYVATNGEIGVETFQQHIDEIDLIVSDIRMPKKDGLSMAKEIKNLKDDIPIVFMTAFGDSDYLQKAIDVGAEGYIVKPIDRNKLFSKLNFLAKIILAKKETNEYMNLIEILFNYQQNGLLLLDEEFNVILYNNAFKAILKYADLLDVKNLEGLLTYCIDVETKQKFTLQDFENKVDTEVNCKSEKTDKYFNIDIKKVERYYLLNISDVTEYYKKTEEIKDKAMKDELTGLYNRKKLELLEEEMINKDVCMIIFDIDNFKKINDTYGHLKGDEVLKLLAKNTMLNLRGSDILIRWGGEEFLVILQNQNSIEVARKLAEKLRLIITQIEVSEVGHFSCSFGVACGQIKEKSDIEKLLNRADEKLYNAKRNGKNRVEY